MPKVTIIVPCYNYARFLGYCINSILRQTMPDFEILVINDASPDNTDEVMAGFRDSRIRYIKHSQNKGHVYTYNEGIDSAKGEFILVLSADDAIKSDFLEVCLSKFSEDKNIGLVFTHICIINAENKEIKLNMDMFRPQKKSGEIGLDKILLSLNCIPHCSAIVPRTVYQNVGKYDSDLPYPCDWDMWLRIAKKYKVWYIDKPHAGYRVHGENQFKRPNVDIYAHDIIYALGKFYSENALSEDLLKVKKTAYANGYLSICYKYFQSGQIRTVGYYLTKAMTAKPAVMFNLRFLFYSIKCIAALFLSSISVSARKAKKILTFPIDLCIFLFLACLSVFYLALLKTYSIKALRARCKVMINLIPGMNISALNKQMGRLGIDRALRFNPQGYFDKSLYIYYSAGNNARKTFDDKNIFIESKVPFGLFYLTYQVKFFYTVLNAILKERAALIHSATPYETGLIGYIAGALTGTPFCVSIRTEYDEAFRLNRSDSVTIYGSRRLAKAVERFVLKRARLVMVRSESLVKYAQNNGAVPGYIKVEPFGLPAEDFIVNSDGGLREQLKLGNNKVVLSVGRLTPYNYSQDIIELAKIVCEKRPDVKFLIIGDGPQMAYLKGLSQETGVYKNIIFYGWQPLEKVSQYRFLADINLCLKGGSSLVEAALSGNPVVTYDVDWHSELIKDGYTGMIVKEGDIGSAVLKIMWLLENPDASKKIGKNAREFAMQRHSYDKVSREKLRWIKEALADKCAA